VCATVSLSACLSVRALKGKRLELSIQKSEETVHGTPSACTDLEVKGSKLGLELGLGEDG